MSARALALAAFAVLAGCQGQANTTDAAGEDTAAPVILPAPSPASNAPVASQAAENPASCMAGEATVFTCRLADGKRVSVCGAGEGGAQYRFGGKVRELTLSGGSYANAMYSGGGESQIAFTNGTARYIVFSRMVRTGFGEAGNAPAISDGVVIELDGRFRAIKLCQDPDLRPVDVDAANAIWSDARELFTEETIRADPQGNE